MNNNYELDDILNEIKKKKQERATYQNSAENTSVPEKTTPPEQQNTTQKQQKSSESILAASLSEDSSFNYEQFFVNKSNAKNISQKQSPDAEKNPILKEENSPEPDKVDDATKQVPDLQINNNSEAPVSENAVKYFTPDVKDDAKKDLSEDRRIKIDDTLHEYFTSSNPTIKIDNTQIIQKKSSVQRVSSPTRHIDLSNHTDLKKSQNAKNTSSVSGDTILMDENLQNISSSSKKEQVIFAPIIDSDEEAFDATEYSSPSQKENILKELEEHHVSAIAKVWITALLFSISMYLAISANLSIGLPSIVSFEQNPTAFIIINVILLCISILVCNSTIGGGLISLLKMRADSDSLPACSALASLIHGIAVAFSSANATAPQNLYFSVGILALMFNAIGKLSMESRTLKNFKFMIEENPSYSLACVEDKNVARNLSGKNDSENYNVAYCAKSEFFSNFIGISYGADLSDSICRSVSPIIIFSSLFISILTFLISKNIFAAFACLSALLAATTPFTSSIAANLPFSSADNTLRSYGASLNGPEAVDTFDAVDSVALDVSDIFNKESVILHNIKTFSKVRIDDAILDAASVISHVKGSLYGVFDNIIAGNKAILKDVDSVVYEDGMGISAWVDSKRVLIGNRSLMINHGIDVPSEDFEAKNIAESQNALYLSNSGELTAMFILEYQSTPESKDAFDHFRKNNLGVIINSTDPNVTPELISRLFDFPEDMITVIPSKIQRDYNNLTKTQKTVKALSLYNCSVFLTSKLIDFSVKIKKKTSALIFMQIIAAVIACAFITFFSFSGNILNIGYQLIIIYQLFWTFCSILISVIGWK